MLLALVAASFHLTPATAITRLVPEEYSTIQAAINASVSGDTVLIGPGTYPITGSQGISFGGRNIVVRSRTGPENTIIDCEYRGLGFMLNGQETRAARIEGLTIKRGWAPSSAPSYGRGGGILCWWSSPTISNCRIVDCFAEYGGGLYLVLFSGLIERCVVSNNYASATGGGIYLDWAGAGEKGPEFRNCLVTDNSSDRGGGVALNSYCVVANCTIASNSGWDDGGGIFSWQSFLLDQSIVWRNCSYYGVDQIVTRPAEFRCSDVDTTGVEVHSGVISYDPDCIFVDPGFCLNPSCGWDPSDWRLQASSPCLPENSPCGALIGALESGCSAAGTCCSVDGACTITVDVHCYSPSIWHPEHTSCDPNPCSAQRACCAPDGSCTITESDDCRPPDTWHSDASFCVPNPCFPPGVNRDGAIIVHTNDAYSYSSGIVCATTLGEPASCAEAVTRTDKSAGAVVWFLAAFGQGSSPRVSGVSFGIDFDEASLDPSVSYGPCGPPSVTEIPDYGWPSGAAGDYVTFGSPVIGDRLFRFYYFVIDDYSGGPPASPFFCSAASPVAGYAAFLGDTSPPAEDRIERFGCVRWYGEGSNDCPEGGFITGACCFTDSHCELLEEVVCLAAPEHIAWLGAGTACYPENPCEAPHGACCDPGTGACAYLIEAACQPPLVWHSDWICQPNYCPPPVRTEKTTWGRIKASFR